MRPCTLRIASAEDDIKATSLDVALVEHAPWCRTAPATLLMRTKPLRFLVTKCHKDSGAPSRIAA